MGGRADRNGRFSVRWYWGKLSALLVFAGIYLVSFEPAVRQNALYEGVAGLGLLLGTIGLSTYLWRWHLSPSRGP